MTYSSSVSNRSIIGLDLGLLLGERFGDFGGANEGDFGANEGDFGANKGDFGVNKGDFGG